MHHVGNLPILARSETAKIDERAVSEADLHAVLSLGVVSHGQEEKGGADTPPEAPCPSVGGSGANGMESVVISAAPIHQGGTDRADVTVEAVAEPLKEIRFYLRDWQERLGRG